MPDVPAENYWFRRHLAVYEWIGAALDRRPRDRHGMRRGLRVRSALALGGERRRRRRQPRGPRARAAALSSGQNLSFERGLVETYGEPGAIDAVVFLQTIEHVQDPVAVLEHLRSLLAPGGVAYVSTPNLLTLAPPGAERSPTTRGTCASTARDEFEALCRTAFGDVRLFGLFHARKLRAARAGVALRMGRGPRQRLRLTKPFYDRFTPAIATSDFALRPGTGARAASIGHWTSSPSAAEPGQLRSVNVF